MTAARPRDYLERVVSKLRRLPAETDWAEFKENNAQAEDIGEYISALSNAAALARTSYGYLLWGVRDADHEIVGTTFKVDSKKVGNEDLENWLLRNLRPQVNFQFLPVDIEGSRLVLLEIEAAGHAPIRFKENEWIRVGSYKKKLRDHPDHAKRLWRALEDASFEQGIARDGVSDEEVVRLLDYPSYFDLLSVSLPTNRGRILSALEADGLIVPSEDEQWSITNLGALLFAREMSEFPSTRRKPLRVIQYRADSRIETLREQQGTRGYAAGFDGMIEFIMNLLPANEVIGKALRQDIPMYPRLAVRELVANALIHQDLSQSGNGPMVEIFADRAEITNPGTPLVEPERFIDAPPRSRNEALASMMRRIGVCEERGSGWDKVGFEIELHQLPAPLIELPQGSTRVTLFGQKPLRSMDKAERVRAVYLHACLRFVTSQELTNSSLRERFGISSNNSAQASRLIAEAVEAGAIAPVDPRAAKKLMRYVPSWASDDEQASGL